jgi:hypothetical protein
MKKQLVMTSILVVAALVAIAVNMTWAADKPESKPATSAVATPVNPEPAVTATTGAKTNTTGATTAAACSAACKADVSAALKAIDAAEKAVNAKDDKTALAELVKARKHLTDMQTTMAKMSATTTGKPGMTRGTHGTHGVKEGKDATPATTPPAIKN